MNAYLLLCSVIFGCAVVDAKGIPSYIELCKRNDPELEKCILRAVDAIQPHMKEGIPELGIPSLDPLTIPFAGLDTGANFNASFHNIELYNADEFKVHKFHADILDKVRLETEVSFPSLRIKSQYSVNGKILFLQLKGAGPADGNFTNVYVTAIGEGKRIQKDGKTYLEVEDIKIKAKYGKPVFLFEHLFENPELSERTNQIINDNIEEFIKELEPIVNDVVVEVTKNLVSRVFRKYSFDELFPV